MEEKNIDPEDLNFLEEDLTRDELISVLFLLYGFENPKWILEKLENPRNKNFLYDYATHHANWKTSIIEALTVTNVLEPVQRLGIRSSEAREHSSRNPINNPGLRLLYEFCENCFKKTTNLVISHIKENCESAKYSDESLLEIFLLHSISNRLIKLAPSLEDCDFTFITNFFNNNKVEEVEHVLGRFPKKSNSLDNSNNLNDSFNSHIYLSAPSTSKASSLMSEYPSRNLQVLIINQQTFMRDQNPELQALLPDHDLNERRGTVKDMEALRLLFENFGFAVNVKTDLTNLEILKEVDRAAKRASQYDGLIVCVLSHGHEGIVYGHNSIPVRIKDIRTIMATKILLGKSKILLIQACQGENLQRSVKKAIPQLEYDGPTPSFMMSGSVYADFLIFWSTIEGFASVRHIDNGSWFIQELVKKIRELHREHHLIDICTAVIKEVSLKRGNNEECMLPKLEATFTRKFRFPEAKNYSNC